jgi:acetolactate synthase-1/3 small subunit
MRRIISILLQNEAGALARVAGLFSARGYNIDSLTVATTHDPSVSRLTLVTYGDERVIDQIVKQSRKLVDVLEIADLTSRDHIEAELLMVKVAVAPKRATELHECVSRHEGARLDDSDGSTCMIRFAGSSGEVNAFLAELETVTRILELARSGTAALERGPAMLMPAADAAA